MNGERLHASASHIEQSVMARNVWVLEQLRNDMFLVFFFQYKELQNLWMFESDNVLKSTLVKKMFLKDVQKWITWLFQFGNHYHLAIINHF